MANTSPSSSLLLIMLLLWCQRSGALKQVLEAKAVAATGGDLWCVAKNNAEDAALQSAIDWACGLGGADCRPIQQGGSCFDPDDIQSHASYAFNNYYLRNGLSSSACDFSGTAALTSLNPSHGSCVFPSSSSSTNGSFSGSASSTPGSAAYDMSGTPHLLLNTMSLVSTCALVGMVSLATASNKFPSP